MLLTNIKTNNTQSDLSMTACWINCFDCVCVCVCAFVSSFSSNIIPRNVRESQSCIACRAFAISYPEPGYHWPCLALLKWTRTLVMQVLHACIYTYHKIIMSVDKSLFLRACQIFSSFILFSIVAVEDVTDQNHQVLRLCFCYD